MTVEGGLALLSGVFVLLFLGAKLLSCSSCHSGQNRFHLAYSATGSSKTLFTISDLEVSLNSLAVFCQIRVDVPCICLLSSQTRFYLD